MMEAITDREFTLIINSLHERANRLMNLSNDMSHKSFRGRDGSIPTIDDTRRVANGSDEHFSLVDKIIKIRDASN